MKTAEICDETPYITVNLVKMAVGVRNVGHLGEIQAKKMEMSLESGEGGELRHITRFTPRRAVEIEDGGSLFWVIVGFISVRQKVVRVERTVRSDGSPACALVLDPQLVITDPVACRPFQGWRYLNSTKAPGDTVQKKTKTGNLPQEMALELKGLGLL